jgi:hypothetical protein
MKARFVRSFRRGAGEILSVTTEMVERNLP